MEDSFVTFYKNPNIDYLFVLHGVTVPTKQDGFRPPEMMKVDEEEKFNYYYEKIANGKSYATPTKWMHINMKFGLC